MEEKIERSEELRDRIIKDEKLLRDLSETISGILKGKVKLEDDETFAFVPLVYNRPVFMPEIFISEDAIEKIPSFGIAGPLDPDILGVLEKFRVRDDDPVPITTLREQILSNKMLLKELSVGISKVLRAHGVAFENDETYAFLPIVFNKPVFMPEPWKTTRIHAFVDGSPVMLGPQPEPPDHPTILARVSIIALIEKYGILPQPFPGPMDPWLLNVLEKYRIQNMR
jgi:hypothetical protein